MIVGIDGVRPTGRIECNSNTLTDQELDATYMADYDLGPGYPQIPVANYIRTLYIDDSIEDLSLRFAPAWSPERQAQLDEDLELSVRRFLGVPPTVQDSIRATFSGSIALDRVLAGVLGRARRSNSRFHHLDVVTTTPCIDIMRLFLEERSDVRAHFVKSRQGGIFGALDVSALTAKIVALRARRPHGAIAVLLSSPENPTGSVWTRDELESIGRTCADNDAVLILDHCFAVAGVHDDSALTRIWDLTDTQADWIAIWDTGKTFGLNEDKLGFIICGNRDMALAIDKALAVIQFGVARRQKMFFAELLRRAIYYGHVPELRAVCKVNLDAAHQLAPSFLSHTPTAGSLLLLDIAQTRMSDEDARSKLLAARIGAVSANVFFHTAWRPKNFLRVALARRPDYFVEALEQLLRVIG